MFGLVGWYEYFMCCKEMVPSLVISGLVWSVSSENHTCRKKASIVFVKKTIDA